MTHIGKRLAALLVLCALVLCGCGRQEQDEPLPKLVIGSDNYCLLYTSPSPRDFL